MKNKKWRNEISAILGIALFYFIIECMGVTCPILYVTGISCAGCGMSRAWLSVLHGDLQAALQFHPLFWMVILMGILFLIRDHMSVRARKWAVIAIAALFIGVYLFRMLDPSDEIVYFRPKTGLIARGLTYFINIIQSHIGQGG